VDAIYTNFGSKFPEAIGRKVQGVAPYNGGAYLKFTQTSGAFKGFSANVGVTGVGKTPTESPTAGDTITRVNGVPTVTASTNQWALTLPAYTLWNLGLHYRWGAGSRFNHTLHFNLNNVFDKFYLKSTGSGSKLIGDGRGIYVSYTLGFSSLFKH
jgi:outer membrane receptor for Fe3+-dicitrate